MLGSSQRKGAASLSADAVRGSQDGARSYDQDHEHEHGPVIENGIHRVLLWVYQHTGLFQLASVLRENTYGSIAISVFFAIAALTHWQAGGGWLSAAVGEKISQVGLLLDSSSRNGGIVCRVTVHVLCRA